MTHKLYIWNNWHNGDIVTTIPLIWEILNQVNDVEIAVGCCSNHAYLYDGIPLTYLKVDSQDDNSRRDLGYMCPEGYTNIYMWLGQYQDITTHNWESQVIVFNRKCKENNIPINLVSNIVPGIRFPYVDIKIKYPSNISKIIWVENGECRSGQNNFIFDINMLATTFPNFLFCTTAPPSCNLSNVRDFSHLNIIELSNLSNKCDIIIGKGSGVFLATYTDINRYKNRVVVGYNLKNFKEFWQYPLSPLKYLDDYYSLENYLMQLN